MLILVNAFFAASEIALISLNDNKIKMMAERGDKKAKMLQKLLAEPSRFLATIQIGITLAGFMASAFAAENFAGKLANYLLSYGVPLTEELLETISVMAITLLLAYFTLVLGELVPKRLALNMSERIARIAVAPLIILSKTSYPFVKLLTGSTNLIVRIFGVKPGAEEENVTEEEIRMMIDVGKEKGAIQEIEKEMIQNIFEFDNKSVSDIITHRIDIVAIPIDANLSETIEVANKEKYTRYPVYEDNIDRIVGILHAKDLLHFAGTGDSKGAEKNFSLTELIREAYFVPETIKTDQLFKDMQKNKIQMAIAIDEYGGTAGIVTMEDLVEEIVGNIFDEYDEADAEIRQIKMLNTNNYLIEGTTNLDDVEKLLKADLPIDDYETLSGFVLGQLRYFPNLEENPTVQFNNLIFKVEEMSERRIEKIQVTVMSTDKKLPNLY